MPDLSSFLAQHDGEDFTGYVAGNPETGETRLVLQFHNELVDLDIKNGVVIVSQIVTRF